MFWKVSESNLTYLCMNSSLWKSQKMTFTFCDSIVSCFFNVPTAWAVFNPTKPLSLKKTIYIKNSAFHHHHPLWPMHCITVLDSPSNLHAVQCNVSATFPRNILRSTKHSNRDTALVYILQGYSRMECNFIDRFLMEILFSIPCITVKANPVKTKQPGWPGVCELDVKKSVSEGLFLQVSVLLAFIYTPALFLLLEKP